MYMTCFVGMQVLVAEAWCPVSGKQQVQDALSEVAQRANSSVCSCPSA